MTDPTVSVPADGPGEPYRVCFVCSGNICRSPMAEAVLRARLAEAGLGAHVLVDSAGTGGWHAGDPADPRATAALVAAGYDARPADHTARQFEAEWFPRYDLVVALDRGHARALRRLAPGPEQAAKVRLLRAGDLDVPDPYYGEDEGFADCLALIEESVPDLLDTIRRRRPGAGEAP
ncbi:low molecular weight protein-tyrosine-phosphatase [Streptomyces marincola]|uniref:low molecular weight protein-tyrosine-phosphatase n=1 Tax=Streptomyces marincola TaxID=2878388 RepID=UPI00269280A9